MTLRSEILTIDSLDYSVVSILDVLQFLKRQMDSNCYISETMSLEEKHDAYYFLGRKDAFEQASEIIDEKINYYKVFVEND